jgi:hypothetical protein
MITGSAVACRDRYNPDLFTPEELAVYVRAYSQPGALRGAFSDYRAGHEHVLQDKEDQDMSDARSLGRGLRTRRQNVGFGRCGTKSRLNQLSCPFRSAATCHTKRNRSLSIGSCLHSCDLEIARRHAAKRARARASRQFGVRPFFTSPAKSG